jgi:hypothetical protein
VHVDICRDLGNRAVEGGEAVSAAIQLDEYRYKNASIAMAFAIAWEEEDQECYVRGSGRTCIALEIRRLCERLKAAMGQPSAK